MRCGWFRMCLLASTLSVALLPSCQSVVSLTASRKVELDACTLQTTKGQVAVTESVWEDGDGKATIRQRRYELYNGDEVFFGSTEAQEEVSNACVHSVQVDAKAGWVRWYDVTLQQWMATIFKPQLIQASCIVLSPESGGEYLIYTPKVYQSLGNGTLQHHPEIAGSIQMSVNAAGYRIQVLSDQIPRGCTAEYTIVQSEEELFDWAGGKIQNFWKGYTMDGDGKWCYDGYYFPSPDSYVPTGENCYYRLPAAYLCKSFAYGATYYRVSEDLAVATLDVMRQQQNDEGFFPTLPKSQWLSGTYRIGPGFYDTRFNTDLTEVFYKMSEWIRCDEFDSAMNRYYDFFLSFAKANHAETASGGWLVRDYYHPEGSKRTHTSLNHQLAEILSLYHAAGYLDRSDLGALADRMLLAIEDTAANWIREDCNLHYAVYPDGSYGGTDYPYLTYNDLYYLRQYLTEQGRESAALQKLMDAKLKWMKASGVTGYQI